MLVETLKAAVKLILWLLLAAATHARAQEALWPTHSSAPPPIVQGFAEFGDVSQTKYHTGLDLGVPLGTPVFPVTDGEVVLIQLLSATSGRMIGMQC